MDIISWPHYSAIVILPMHRMAAIGGSFSFSVCRLKLVQEAHVVL